MADTTTSEGRVFVSSPCYDLLDARAELERTLGEAGLQPVLSDRPSSEFQNPGDANSIETCLVNLRKCERCVVLLSQRYGPSLKKAGFDDISATHLEYREAIKAGIPVAVYVRDRLWAEYSLAKKNKTMQLQWANSDDAAQLFAFIHEHAKLSNEEKPNWVWQFSSSVDLCARVLADLGTTAQSALIRMLTQQGRLPLFSLNVEGHQGDIRNVMMRNVGLVPAMRVTVRHPSGGVVMPPMDFEPNRGHLFNFRFSTSSFSACPDRSPVLLVDYEASSGDWLSELWAILPGNGGAIRLAPAGRRVAGKSLRSTCPELAKVGGLESIPLPPVTEAFYANRL